MGTTLQTYPSASNPHKSHEIIRGHDGKTYCTCWQWKLKRTCKHLEHYLSSNKEKWHVTYRTEDGKPTMFLDLAQAIENAVKELS